MNPSHRSPSWLPVACAVALIMVTDLHRSRWAIHKPRKAPIRSPGWCAGFPQRRPHRRWRSTIVTSMRLRVQRSAGTSEATGLPVLKWVGEPPGPDRALEQRCRVARRTILRSLQLSTYPDGELNRGVRHQDDDAPAVDALACWPRLGDLGRLWRRRLVGVVRALQRPRRRTRQGVRGDPARSDSPTTGGRQVILWTFPQPVVARWGEMSSSGGTLRRVVVCSTRRATTRRNCMC